jgi:4-hydroxy-3-methylbut-2-en-1-yl diphosphate reductase
MTDSRAGRLLALAPLAIEARAIRSGTHRARIERTGMGPTKSAASAAALRTTGGVETAVAVVGLGGSLIDGLVPGELVVGDKVLAADGTVVCELPGAGLLAAALRQAGLTARVGSVVTVDHIVKGSDERADLARLGAVVVDMESSALLALPWGRPTAVVRAISDAPGQDLISPKGLVNVTRALRAIRAAGPVLEAWAAACGPRTIVKAEPRSFCAGVSRAINSVEAAIKRFGAPIYVRRQIVHNDHVVSDLETKGAVFVRELEEVPDGATVVFSAHGVGQAVRAEAAGRQLHVIDATCPLVAKVHSEVRRFTERDYEVVLIGHAGHDEVEGTLGEVPGIHLVQTPDDVASLDIHPNGKVAYATQTTLAPDEVETTVTALKGRFAELTGPRSSDICYATHNRQEAVRGLAEDCDLILVVGSATSSNSHRLVEVARRAGCRSELIDDESGLRLDWLPGADRIGLTAGASAPDFLVQQVADAIGALGELNIQRRPGRHEAVSFSLPPEVR